MKRVYRILLFTLIFVLCLTAFSFAGVPNNRQQSGTNSFTGQVRWQSAGYIFEMDGMYTSLSRHNDAAILHESHISTRHYSTSPNIQRINGVGFVFEQSINTPFFNGSTGWFNRRILIKPEGFDPRNPVRGRSVVDNLVVEAGFISDAKQARIINLLVTQNNSITKHTIIGTSWYNSGPVGSIAGGPQTRGGRRWLQHSNSFTGANYRIPPSLREQGEGQGTANWGRVYTSVRNAQNAGSWTTGTNNIFPYLYNINFTLPILTGAGEPPAPPSNVHFTETTTIDRDASGRTNVEYIRPGESAHIRWTRTNNWGFPTTGSHYQIQRRYWSESNGSWNNWTNVNSQFNSSATSGTSSQSFNASTFSNSTRVQFRVRARSNGGTSGWSTSKVYHLDHETPTRNHGGIYDEDYFDGTNYWYGPGSTARVHIGTQDNFSGPFRHNIHLIGSDFNGNSIDFRARHLVGGNNAQQIYNSETGISLNTERYRNFLADKRSRFLIDFTGNRFNHSSMDVRSHHQDKMGNNQWQSYFGTIKTDFLPAEHISHKIEGHQYQNGNDYWTQPGRNIDVFFRGRDNESGLERSYLRLTGSGEDFRVSHNWNQATGNFSNFRDSNVIDMVSVGRTYSSGNTREARFRTNPSANLDTYNVQYYYRDNVGNNLGYGNSGMRLRTDGIDPTVTASITSMSWTSNPSDVTLTYADIGSGIATRQYQWSTSTSPSANNWTNASSNTPTISTPSNNGRWYLHYRATDNVGNETSGRFGTYNIDRTNPTPPTLNLIEEWTNENRTFTITGGSAFSGISHYQYRSRNVGGTWSAWTNGASGTISIEGETEVQARAVSNVGLFSNTTGIRTARVDKTPPARTHLSISGADYINGNDYWIKDKSDVVVRVTTEDFKAGVRRHNLELSDNNFLAAVRHFASGTIQEYQSENGLTVNPSIINTNQYLLRSDFHLQFDGGNTHDKDLNIRTYHEDFTINARWINSNYRIRTDYDAPTIDFNIASRLHTHPYKVDVAVEDHRSGIKKIEYQVTGSSTISPTNWNTGSSDFSVDIDQLGTYYIHVRSEDNVGNVRTVVGGPYRIFNEAPTVSFSHTPEEPMINDDMTVNIAVNDVENDEMTVDLELIDPSNNQRKTKKEGSLHNGDVLSIDFHADLPGRYTVNLVISDLFHDVHYTYHIDILEANVEGFVRHTENWNENRQKFNIRKSGHTDFPHMQNQTFFAGEKFMLSSNTDPNQYAEKVVVHIEEHPQIEPVELERDSLNNWEGEMWDKTMITWTGQDITFVFTATYQNGYVATDEVQVTISNEKYWQQRNRF